MKTSHTLTPDDPRFPPRLVGLRLPAITLSSPLGPGLVVAIVGTREPAPEAEQFARELAAECAAAGIVVASGGAVGIDAAAHRGALEAGGRTWAVLPTGCNHVSPREHASLFERIAQEEGTLIWPFPPDQRAHYHTYHARNRVLVALSDAVVVVQAGIPSGALNTAKHARRFERPLWVVAPPAWSERFAGSLALVDLGARVLTRGSELLCALGVVPRVTPRKADIQPRRPRASGPPRKEAQHTDRLDGCLVSNKSFVGTDGAQAVFQVAESMPLHIDELTERTRLPAATVSTALLTLALENVLVEGPNGFFRRAEGYKHLSSLNFLPKDAENDGEDARSRRVARQGEDDQEVSGGSVRRRRIEGAR
ncbi:DNA-processing protein DprA [Pendulispora albinea]|uniref:DNA-protecting protein DprA n=1 Tax=Pendulispora albinea TaxID=2741071 RepID=A0ABZ2M4D5_9BACT